MSWKDTHQGQLHCDTIDTMVWSTVCIQKKYWVCVIESCQERIQLTCMAMRAERLKNAVLYTNTDFPW